LQHLIACWQKYRFFFGAVFVIMTGSIYLLVFGATNPTKESLLIEPATPLPVQLLATPKKVSGNAAVLFHIAGAVRCPGVYMITNNSFVYEAVRSAGGLLPGADLDKINLAARLQPGTKIKIPFLRAHELVSPSCSTAAGIDINQASIQELTCIKGVGPVLAQKIVDYREANGPFQTVEQLTNIKGIGKNKLAKIKKSIFI
jgi:competence protein ComEA